jgi:hypothetical protein
MALHISFGHRDGGTFRRLRYSGPRGHCDFVLDPTVTQLWVQWTDGIPRADIRSLLTGEPMGHVLRLRGVTCLHASTVAIGEGAVAVLGPKGAGKSTLAAALAAAGHAILTDDISPLSERDAGFTVEPGFTRIRLCPDAAQALHGTIAGLAPVWQIGNRKHYVDLSADDHAAQWRFQADPLPLRAVYVLAPRSPTYASSAMAPLSPREALAALPPHIYYAHVPLRRDQLMGDLRRLAHLAQATPVYRLAPPDGLHRLPEVCEAMLRNAHAPPVG